MTAFRITLIVLSTINILFTLLTAAVGLFADGGDTWSRLVISGLHPLAAVAIVLFFAFSEAGVNPELVMWPSLILGGAAGFGVWFRAYKIGAMIERDD